MYYTKNYLIEEKFFTNKLLRNYLPNPFEQWNPYNPKAPMLCWDSSVVEQAMQDDELKLNLTKVKIRRQKRFFKKVEETKRTILTILKENKGYVIDENNQIVGNIFTNKVGKTVFFPSEILSLKIEINLVVYAWESIITKNGYRLEDISNKDWYPQQKEKEWH